MALRKKGEKGRGNAKENAKWEGKDVDRMRQLKLTSEVIIIQITHDYVI